jgi:hypothetical protein
MLIIVSVDAILLQTLSPSPVSVLRRLVLPSTQTKAAAIVVVVMLLVVVRRKRPLKRKMCCLTPRHLSLRL